MFAERAGKKNKKTRGRYALCGQVTLIFKLPIIGQFIGQFTV